MVNVLIATKPDDTHALYVKLALEKKGHHATLWQTADFPQQQTQTFKLINDEMTWSFRGVNLEMSTQKKFDAVWLRRPRKPVSSSIIHADDYENTNNELNAFFKNIWHVIEPDAFWINPVEKLSAANCKLKQLKIAAEIGLNTPKTLVSNDAKEIKKFISEYPENEVIYKTLHPVYWPGKNETSIRLTYTKSIKLAQLPSDAILQNAPGIFQQKINKDFELRITYFGEHAIAAKLRSQEHPKGMMDWRYVPRNELIVEPFTLPETIHKKCKTLMKKLGIVFGCFDFIVTPEGDYYFLEVNEQGQFLWIEDSNPKIKMLDAFTEFLVHCASDFKWHESDNTLSMRDFNDEVAILQNDALNIHIRPTTLG
jgi:glutathione synthase/RimK-type ligase-like ATP-grasp enzyme